MLFRAMNFDQISDLHLSSKIDCFTLILLISGKSVPDSWTITINQNVRF